MNFFEKHIRLITFILSCITFIFVFMCMKPTFLVRANEAEEELLLQGTKLFNQNHVETEDFIQNLKLVTIKTEKQYTSVGTTRIKSVPNIIAQNDDMMEHGDTGFVLCESEQWITILYKNKIVYISKMNISSLPEEKKEIQKIDDLDKKQNDTKETEKPKESAVETEKELTYSIKEVDKCQYVSASSLNVRKGPDTKYSKIGSLGQNEKVHVIGLVDNGWVQIKYNDKKAFVSGKYLSDKKVEVKKSTSGNNLSNYPNAYGILKISSLGVDVVLYDKSIYESSQSIVDKKNSAAYLWATECYGMDLIADHQHQGFNVISKAKPGSTKAKIYTHNGTKTYVCTEKFVGKNLGHDMIDKNGISITGRNNGGICMYTCYPKHPDIIITFWQPC